MHRNFYLIGAVLIEIRWRLDLMAYFYSCVCKCSSPVSSMSRKLSLSLNVDHICLSRKNTLWLRQIWNPCVTSRITLLFPKAIGFGHYHPLLSALRHRIRVSLLGKAAFIVDLHVVSALLNVSKFVLASLDALRAQMINKSVDILTLTAVIQLLLNYTRLSHFHGLPLIVISVRAAPLDLLLTVVVVALRSIKSTRKPYDRILLRFCVSGYGLYVLVVNFGQRPFGES